MLRKLKRTEGEVSQEGGASELGDPFARKAKRKAAAEPNEKGTKRAAPHDADSPAAADSAKKKKKRAT